MLEPVWELVEELYEEAVDAVLAEESLDDAIAQTGDFFFVVGFCGGLVELGDLPEELDGDAAGFDFAGGFNERRGRCPRCRCEPTTQRTGTRFAFRFLLVPRLFPVRFGRWRVQTTRAVRVIIENTLDRTLA